MFHEMAFSVAVKYFHCILFFTAPDVESRAEESFFDGEAVFLTVTM